MNYIQQAYKGKYEFWKYLIVPGIFIGLMLGQMILIDMFELDVEALTKADIAESGENAFLIKQLLPLVFFLLFLLLFVKFIHKQSITSLTTARKKVDWKRIGFAFVFWGVLAVGMVLIDYYFNPDHYVFNFKLKPFLTLAAIAILMVPLQTSFEEYLFRGYLMQGIGILAKNRWLPLVLTSVIFGAMHMANPEVGKLGNIIMIYYIGTGFFLGIITLMDEGLELALGFHAANNLFIVLLVTADWTAFQTHSILKDISDPTESTFLDVIIPVLVLYPLLLVVFSKMYKWNHWKDRLFGSIERPTDTDLTL